MGDDHAGWLEFLLQHLNEFGDHIAANWIQACRRFVVQEALRPQHDCPGERDALPLPAGEFGRKPINQRIDSKQREGVADAGQSRRRVHLRMFSKREGHILQHRHRVEERALLEQKADASSDLK